MPKTAVVEASPSTTHFPSVEDIIQAWCKELLKKYPELRGRVPTVNKVTPEHILTDITYSPATPLPGKAWSATAVTFCNDSDVEQGVTYEASEEVATTTTATVERSFDTEARFELSLKWPVSESGFTESLTVRSGQRDVKSTAKSVTDARKISVPVRVPPHQVISAQAHAEKKTQRVSWTARAAVFGTWEFGMTNAIALFNLPEILMEAHKRQIIDMPGWEFKRLNEAQMREAIGGPAFNRMYPRIFGPDKTFILATGMVTGEMTFENFVDIHVEVRKLETAYAGEIAETGEAGNRAVRGGKVIESLPVPGPGEVVARQDDMLGVPVTVYERR